MSDTNFNKIPGTTGTYRSNLELELVSPNVKKIKSELTMKNKSIEWQINFLKKKLKFWKKILETSIDDSIVISDPAARARASSKLEAKQAQAREKIPEIESAIASLIPQVKEELFTETAPNTLVVPPGMWFVCDSIYENTHLNTTLKPYFLPECRPYQVESLQALYQYNRATVELATGLGKSKIIQSMAIAAVLSGMRVMIVVPTEYLVGQMHAQMKALHPNTTAQGGGRQAELGWDILVTTIQSAQMFADLPNVILLDESHHAPASTWTDLLMKAESADHVYSFTATAFRADGLDMAIHSFAGPVVYSRDVRWGIQNEYLSNFHPFSIEVQPRYHGGPKDGRPIVLGDSIQGTTAYKILGASFEVFQVARDKLLRALEKGRKPIVIFKTVEACKKFRKFCEPIIDLDVASAQEGKKSKYPLRMFQENKAPYLLANSGLISEGIDCPYADCLIQCTQNSSDVMTLQMLGRVLRKPEGKKDAVVIDIVTGGFAQFVRAGERRNELYAKIVGENNLKKVQA